MDRNSLKASNATSSTTTPLGRSGASGDSSSRTDERFHLTGPSLTLDPRIHAYRKDIADIALAGPDFRAPLCPAAARAAAARGRRRCARQPSTEAEAVATLAPGEAFAVLEYAGGWAWGYVQAGHRVGYVEAAALAASAA